MTWKSKLESLQLCHDPDDITDFGDVCNHGVGSEYGELATRAVGPDE
jgi:hypothetical protein